MSKQTKDLETKILLVFIVIVGIIFSTYYNFKTEEPPRERKSVFEREKEIRTEALKYVEKIGCKEKFLLDYPQYDNDKYLIEIGYPNLTTISNICNIYVYKITKGEERQNTKIEDTVTRINFFEFKVK